jgi:hypothetical protein
MPVFAEIVLAVSLCVPGAGGAGQDACSDKVPESWVSADVQQFVSDWNDCKAKEAVYPRRPGAETAVCRYTRVLGGDV